MSTMFKTSGEMEITKLRKCYNKIIGIIIIKHSVCSCRSSRKQTGYKVMHRNCIQVVIRHAVQCDYEHLQWQNSILQHLPIGCGTCDLVIMR